MYVLVIKAVGLRRSSNNQEGDARALLEFPTPSAQEPSSLHAIASTVLVQPHDLFTSQRRAPVLELSSPVLYTYLL